MRAGPATPARPAQPKAAPAQPATTARAERPRPRRSPAQSQSEFPPPNRCEHLSAFMTMTVNQGCDMKASKRLTTASPHPNRHQRSPHTPTPPTRRGRVPCPITGKGSPACAAPLILLSGRKHLRAPLAQLARTARRQHPACRDGDDPGDSANVCGHSISDNSRLARRVPWGRSLPGHLAVISRPRTGLKNGSGAAPRRISPERERPSRRLRSSGDERPQLAQRSTGAATQSTVAHRRAA